jgi:predicted HicB family RNase H-like nuclease
MNVLTYKRYSARVEFNAENGLFVGQIAGINDIVDFHGISVDEFKAALGAQLSGKSLAEGADETPDREASSELERMAAKS